MWFFWERYWHWRQLDIAQAIKLNPFSGGDSKDKRPANEIDGTKIENLMALAGNGLPVKMV